MWDWLIEHGIFSPMTNVESLMFAAGSSCDLDSVVYNSLLGSWNLSLQALGSAHYLAKLHRQEPALYTATIANPLLRRGYGLLAPERAICTESGADSGAGSDPPLSRLVGDEGVRSAR